MAIMVTADVTAEAEPLVVPGTVVKYTVRREGFAKQTRTAVIGFALGSDESVDNAVDTAAKTESIPDEQDELAKAFQANVILTPDKPLWGMFLGKRRRQMFTYGAAQITLEEVYTPSHR